MGDDEEAMLFRGILCQVEQSFRLPNPITESLEGLELELAPEN
jgi:2Fe-2S ferredoxin